MIPTITLKPREDKRLRMGHQWVFSNEIASVEPPADIGSLVRVVAHHGLPLGVGLYNPHSLIAVRITDAEERDVDAEWFAERIAAALQLRRQLYPGQSCWRLLHSESDRVPGVIVDRYGSVMVVQIASAGIEQRRELLFDALMDVEGVEGVVERNDHSGRTLEGLAERVGIVRGHGDVQIVGDGILRYEIDPLGGQKTGLYLDQRENRLAIRRYAPQARVLDLFCNSGGFALHARHAGAAAVTAVDSSEAAIEQGNRNAELNGLNGIDFRAADAFAVARDAVAAGERFDLVIADPPPFARSKKHVAAARRRYVELLGLALTAAADDGVVFFSTCSYHITEATFEEIVREGLRRSSQQAVVLERRGAAPDHPVHPLMPESGYLRGVVLRKY